MKEELKGFEYPDGTNFDTYNDESITNYYKSIINGNLKYFLSNDKELNIIVRLSVPAGMGYSDKIITIR